MKRGRGRSDAGVSGAVLGGVLASGLRGVPSGAMSASTSGSMSGAPGGVSCGASAAVMRVVLCGVLTGVGQVVAAELPIAGGGPVSVGVTSIREARYLSTVRQQYDFSCGSAALATLLTHHYGYPVSERQAFSEMYARGDQVKIRREGFSLLDMKRFLAAHGFQADGFQQPLDTLAQAGFPAIVLVAERGYHHFVVVKGVREGRVLVGDPSGGTRALPRAAFEAMWLNQLLFVIHGLPGKPRFNEPAEWAVAPRMQPGAALNRDSLQHVTLPKLGAGDF